MELVTYFLILYYKQFPCCSSLSYPHFLNLLASLFAQLYHPNNLIGIEIVLKSLITCLLKFELSDDTLQVSLATSMKVIQIH